MTCDQNIKIQWLLGRKSVIVGKEVGPGMSNLKLEDLDISELVKQSSVEDVSGALTAGKYTHQGPSPYLVTAYEQLPNMKVFNLGNIRYEDPGTPEPRPSNFAFEDTFLKIQPNGIVTIQGWAHSGKIETQRGFSETPPGLVIGFFRSNGIEIAPGWRTEGIPIRCGDPLKQKFQMKVNREDTIYSETAAVMVFSGKFWFWICGF